MIKKNINKIAIAILTLLLFTQNVQASDKVSSDFDSYVNQLKTFTENSGINVDLNNLASNLKSGKGLSYNSIFEIVASLFFKEVRVMLKSSIIIVIFIIISSIIKSIALDKESEVMKLTNIICFISLNVIIITNLTSMIEVFKGAVSIVNNLAIIISPFLFGLLIINGAVTTVGIIQPLILFAASFINYIISNVILPVIILSISFSVIGSINDKNGISRLGNFFRKTSLWLLGIFLTIFIAILSMETTITKDVDALAVKTATAAVSNFVPVVGKFFSDSFETVIGASKVITKSGGVLGIIVIIIVSSIPIIKLIASAVIYTIISIISEIIDADSKFVTVLSDFAEVYKTLCGILIVNSSIFIIIIAIILNMSSSIVK